MVLEASPEFIDLAERIRAGDLDAELAELGSIRAPEAFKAMVRGEVAAFQHDWDTCLVESRRVVEAALSSDSPWYSGNPVAEHLRLHTFAALRAGQQGQAITWLDGFVARPELRWTGTLAATARAALLYRTPLADRARAELPPVITDGHPMSTLYPLLAENRPRVPPDSVDGLSYLLHFAARSVTTSDVLAAYESVADAIGLASQHQPIAMLYLAIGDEDGAWRTVRRFVRAWWPIEHSQVEPITLFNSYALAGLLTRGRCAAILRRDVGPPRVSPELWPTPRVTRSSAIHPPEAVVARSDQEYMQYRMVDVHDPEVSPDDIPAGVSGAWSTWTPRWAQMVVGHHGAVEITVVRGSAGNGVLVFDGTVETASGALVVESMLDDVDIPVPIGDRRAVRIRVFVDLGDGQSPSRAEILVDDAAPIREGTYGAFIPRDDETFTPHMFRTKAEIAAGLDPPSSLGQP